MGAHAVDELRAAVRQALENVVQHARAERATVFAEEEGTTVTVSVRDDGVGFTYDEQVLVRDSKVGILRSMKGRVEDLGGRMEVTSAPGKGTEIEFVVPKEPTDG
jgi:signal transduction histidine kinase